MGRRWTDLDPGRDEGPGLARPGPGRGPRFRGALAFLLDAAPSGRSVSRTSAYAAVLSHWFDWLYQVTTFTPGPGLNATVYGIFPLRPGPPKLPLAGTAGLPF